MGERGGGEGWGRGVEEQRGDGKGRGGMCERGGLHSLPLLLLVLCLPTPSLFTQGEGEGDLKRGCEREENLLCIFCLPTLPLLRLQCRQVQLQVSTLPLLSY